MMEEALQPRADLGGSDSSAAQGAESTMSPISQETLEFPPWGLVKQLPVKSQPGKQDQHSPSQWPHQGLREEL